MIDAKSASYCVFRVWSTTRCFGIGHTSRTIASIVLRDRMERRALGCSTECGCYVLPRVVALLAYSCRND